MSGRWSSADALPTLLLVDAQLPDLAFLLADLPTGVQPLLVSRQADALSLVQHWRETLPAEAGGLSPQPWRLAVVAHGALGQVAIGREGLNAASVQAREQEWCALAPAAIDLYSCHTGVDLSLAKALNASCGAHVHTSRGVVGHACVGGSWALQAAHQAPAAANAVVPFSRAALAAWEFGLATIYFGTPSNSNGAGTFGDPYNQAGVNDNSSTIFQSGNTVVINEGTLSVTATQADLVTFNSNSAGSSGTVQVDATGFPSTQLSLNGSVEQFTVNNLAKNSMQLVPPAPSMSPPLMPPSPSTPTLPLALSPLMALPSLRTKP